MIELLFEILFEVIFMPIFELLYKCILSGYMYVFVGLIPLKKRSQKAENIIKIILIILAVILFIGLIVGIVLLSSNINNIIGSVLILTFLGFLLIGFLLKLFALIRKRNKKYR